MTSGRSRALMRLAALHGVQTSYRDIESRRREATDETLVCLLRALGVSIETAADARAACAEAEAGLRRRYVEPVIVAWDGVLPAAIARFESVTPPGRIECRIRAWDPEIGERGKTILLRTRVAPVAGRFGAAECRVSARAAGPLPHGYHILKLRSGKFRGESLVVSAPSDAPAPRAAGPAWGGFIPLYAVRSERNWGIGDFSDLGELASRLGGMGGSYLGTLPLHAAFLDKPMEPSPYAPASRLFLNELYLDVTALPEFEACEAARRLVAGAAFRSEIESLRRKDHVDHRRLMALKRRALQEMSGHLWSAGTPRARAFRRLWREEVGLIDYARFRAAGEKRRTVWQEWPEPMRSGRIAPAEFDARDERYHVYAQWAAREQFTRAARAAETAGVGFYLDFPLGVHSASYDTYRMRDLFMDGVGVGAPPDAFFTAGQTWGFQAPHPGRLRESRYAYFIAALRKLMTRAAALRIDHVMGFHRLFCVPEGLGPAAGTYIRYPAEEMYAIVALEAERARCMVIGEDLGVVPPEVRAMMARHGFRRTYVMEMEASPDASPPVPEPPRRSLACLNTHDMPTFASFWTGADVAWREAHGHLDRKAATRERRRRAALRKALARFFAGKVPGGGKPGTEEALRASLRYLAAGRAETLLINLEDLWLEREPQNIPGTWKEHPNWKRKASVRMEEMRRPHPAAGLLEEVDNLRRRVRAKRRASGPPEKLPASRRPGKSKRAG